MPDARLILTGIAAAVLGQAASVRTYLEVNGRESKPDGLRVEQRDSRITVNFRAPSDGTFRFGVAVSGAGLLPLSVDRAIAPVLRYPYDWTSRGLTNVLTSRPRLVMPGVEADGRLYIVDTHELFSIIMQPGSSGSTRALLLAHRFYNDGADRATADLMLHAGDRREFTVLIFPDMKAANLARFGEHTPIPPGTRTQPPFREWADASLTPEQYQLMARKLAGTFRYVEIREREPLAYVPPIFHKLGMQVYHYQYMGALRRHSSEVTPEIEREVAMRDKEGRIMTAPRPLDANWLLADIRRPDVRARFVESARAAIRNGFDGVSLDGYPFWPDPNGEVGGNAPGADHSWAYARWLLLREMKAAMHAENSNAKLDVLANSYFDSLGEADTTEKERMYFEWDVKTGKGNTAVRKDLDVKYEEQEAPYVPGPITYGVKGASPLSVQTAMHLIRHPTGLFYTDAGDFPMAQMESWLDTVVATMKPSDLYISNIEPASCWVHFEGAATIHSDENCTVTFSRPACVSRQPDNRRVAGEPKLQLERGVRYVIARSCGEGGR
jgi:hypothetical protein